MGKTYKPLTENERQYATENYHLIMEFLKRERLNPEEFFDVVVFEYLDAVGKYLNSEELKGKCSFAQVSYMYMKRAVYRYFRERKTLKRSSECGADISFEDADEYIKDIAWTENNRSIEFEETLQQIKENLSDERWKIFCGKLNGYSLKEVAEQNGINQKRVYKQFEKVKIIVADVMEINL